MRVGLERTAEYLRERHAFGKPLLANQHLQYTLAELSAELDLLRSYNYSIADKYQRGIDTTREATIAKLTAGRLVRKVADACLQYHGGMGYVEETWTARFFRDNRLSSIGGERRGDAASACSPRRIHRLNRQRPEFSTRFDGGQHLLTPKFEVWTSEPHAPSRASQLASNRNHLYRWHHF